MTLLHVITILGREIVQLKNVKKNPAQKSFISPPPCSPNLSPNLLIGVLKKDAMEIWWVLEMRVDETWWSAKIYWDTQITSDSRLPLQLICLKYLIMSNLSPRVVRRNLSGLFLPNPLECYLLPVEFEFKFRPWCHLVQLCRTS